MQIGIFNNETDKQLHWVSEFRRCNWWKREEKKNRLNPLEVFHSERKKGKQEFFRWHILFSSCPNTMLLFKERQSILYSIFFAPVNLHLANLFWFLECIECNSSDAVMNLNNSSVNWQMQCKLWPNYFVTSNNINLAFYSSKAHRQM